MTPARLYYRHREKERLSTMDDRRIVEFGLIAALITVAIICATNILVYAT